MTTSLSIGQVNTIQSNPKPAPQVSTVSQPSISADKSNMLMQYMQNRAVVNSTLISAPAKVSSASNKNVKYTNNLRQMFQNNEAKIFAFIPRTFTADDKNGDDIVQLGIGEEQGNFNKAITRLDEIKSYGFNTLHILPN